MVFRCSRFRKMCVKVISHMLFVRCHWHVKIVTLHKRLFWSLKAHSFKAYSSSLIWRGYWIGNSENNIIIKTNISFFPSERHQQASATLFKFNGLKLSRTRKSQNKVPVEKKTLLNKTKQSQANFTLKLLIILPFLLPLDRWQGVILVPGGSILVMIMKTNPFFKKSFKEVLKTGTMYYSYGWNVKIIFLEQYSNLKWGSHIPF